VHFQLAGGQKLLLTRPTLGHLLSAAAVRQPLVRPRRATRSKTEVTERAGKAVERIFLSPRVGGVPRPLVGSQVSEITETFGALSANEGSLSAVRGQVVPIQ